MGFALVGRCEPGGFTGAATASYTTLPGGGAAISNATENRTQNIARVAGTFSNLTCYLNNVGTGRTCQFRKNTANGNQVVNPTDITTGVFTDAVNTDAVVATDLFNLNFSEAVGATAWYWFNALFKATTGHACYYVLGGDDNLSSTISGSTRYFPLCGKILQNSTESQNQVTARVGGTIQNFQLYVRQNSAAVTDTFKSRINGVDGNCSIAVGSGLTGLFEDTTHTDTFNSGDLLNYSVAWGVDANTRIIWFVGCCIVSASSPINDIFSTGSIARSASATLHYFPILGALAASLITAEDNTTAIRHQFPCITSKLRINVSANTYAANSTLQLRKNLTTNLNQVVTITAGVTGLFEDTTHTDTLAVGDDIACSIVGGTSGSITIRSIGLLEQDNTAVADTLMAQAVMG